ncbi:MAG: hypothetical protein M0R38_03505 [Bacteroidia bacterium]|nr:hypothetical protein [Bacteroidia bacterium]
MKNKFLLSIFLMGAWQISFAQLTEPSKSNLVHPNDSRLSINEKYNNPGLLYYTFRINPGVGFDASRYLFGIYYAMDVAFAPKHFYFQGVFQSDLIKPALSQAKYISTGSNLTPYTLYRNIELTAVYNYQDEVKDMTVYPTVGYKFLSSEVTSVTSSSITTTTTGYFFHTKYTKKIRESKGVGVSLIQFNSIAFYGADTTKFGWRDNKYITFKNNEPMPASFYVPFSQTTIGIGFHTNTYAHYKVAFQYNYQGTELLKKRKYKDNSYSNLRYELLISPLISTYGKIYYTDSITNSTATIDIASIRKRMFGFRIVANVGKKPGFYSTAELGMRTGIIPIPASKYVTQNNDNDGNAIGRGLVKIMAPVIVQPWYLKWTGGFAF